MVVLDCFSGFNMFWALGVRRRWFERSLDVSSFSKITLGYLLVVQVRDLCLFG